MFPCIFAVSNKADGLCRCRDTLGMSSGGNQGFQANLASTEDRWLQLQKEAVNLQSSSVTMRTANANSNNPYRNSSATTLVPDGPLDLQGDNPYLRQRQHETAKEVQAYLSTASELLSTASTVCGVRTSFDDVEQSPERREAVLDYIQQQQSGEPPRSQEKPRSIWLMVALFLPCMIAMLFLMFFYLWFGTFLFLYTTFWFLAQMFMGFKNFRDHRKRLHRDIGKAHAWFAKSWHGVLGLL